jgi:hypothetical protein
VVQTADLAAVGSNPKILGRDGGYSGVFAGNSIWVYGDTFLANPNAKGETLISGSWASTTDMDAADGITGFQEREDAAGVAPSSIVPLWCVPCIGCFSLPWRCSDCVANECSKGSADLFPRLR